MRIPYQLSQKTKITFTISLMSLEFCLEHICPKIEQTLNFADASQWDLVLNVEPIFKPFKLKSVALTVCIADYNNVRY